MKPIRKTTDLGRRVQEAGKIRMGIKGAKGAPKSINTWRFTSPHRDCIEQLAALYGGTVKPWSDPKASPNDQFEVITEAEKVRVLIPPNGVSINYELWAGSGVQRRCDGELCHIVERGEELEVPCICFSSQKMECKPYTRITVVFPDIVFRGTWTLTTKSWNAADEIPAMERMIDQLQRTQDIIEVDLGIEQRSRITSAGKRKFVVPTLSFPHTAQELAGGAARFALDTGARAVTAAPQGELGPGSEPFTDDDDEVVEVIPDTDDLLNEIDALAHLLMFDADKLETGIALGVSDQTAVRVGLLDDDQLIAADAFLRDVRAERITITKIRDDGRLSIVRP